MTPVVLAISSHVVASTLGLRANTPALHAHGVEVWPAPTLLLGAHPELGGPPGQALTGDELAAELEGARGHPDAGRIAWVLTGHFSNLEQIDAVEAALDGLAAVAPGFKLCVDPIMGDAGRGLYIKPEVAEALAARLVPRAALVTPNVWEAEQLSGVAVTDPLSALAAAAELGAPAALITSVRPNGGLKEDRIGAVYIDPGHALFAHAPERKRVPNGTGDLLAAAFLGARIAGAAPAEALLDAVRRVEGALAAAEAAGLAELPAAAIARSAVGPAVIEAIER